MLEFLPQSGVLPGVKATSKKQTLQDLARQAAQLTGLHERTIFDALLERERLGTTGIGRGVAVPHARLSQLDRVYGLFARLVRPIDFDSVDEQPVDLVFLLLAPEAAGADHLKALARVSRLLRDEGLCETLRGCETRDAILAVFAQRDAATAA